MITGSQDFRKLNESVSVHFDTEYLDAIKFSLVTSQIDNMFDARPFSFLDIGGGNGCFADRLLRHYPLAAGTVLDYSSLLIGKNEQHSRKTLIYGSYVSHLRVVLSMSARVQKFFSYS